MNIKKTIVMLGIAIMFCENVYCAPEIEQTAEMLKIELGNGSRLHFALAEELFSGLLYAEVDGLALKSDKTVQRPLIVQDSVNNPRVIQSYRLLDAKVDEGRVVLTLESLLTDQEKYLSEVFVMRGNRDKAEREGMNPELRELRQAAEAAQKILDEAALASGDGKLLEEYEKLGAAEAALAGMQEEERDTYQHVLLLDDVRRTKNRFDKRRDNALKSLFETMPELSKAREDIEKWNTALNKRAADFTEIHRDYYKFPIWRQPNEINLNEAVLQRARAAAETGRKAGTVRWIIEPHAEEIAGWLWTGWRQYFEIDLPDAIKVNHIAVLGTWELGGHPDGVSIIALRYRGLGGLVQSFTKDSEGAVNEAFSTTEIIPGAAGGAPLISPVVDEGSHGGDRAFALRHRVGAWIAQPARGAGAPFLDVQYRDGAIFAAVPERQGNLRAVTEVMPGDKHISQTDLEYFVQSNRHRTIPFRYLVLKAADRMFAENEIRTRYQEIDQHVRDFVSAELGFVQYEVLPGAHYLLDHNFDGQVRGLANDMPALAQEGVRRIETHHPGWINGRVRDQGMEHIGGGMCDIYDYWPLQTVQKPWKALTQACVEHDVAYFVWLTGMCRMGGALHRSIGNDPQRWAFNRPDASSLVNESTGYRGNNNFNVKNAVTRETLLKRLEEVRQEFGYQGFWADSFQNLFMSQLDWGQGSGDSLQRTWWEIIAEWSRSGVGWTAESHSFPGQSCSIEVQGGWGLHNFFLATHVNRAYRANSFPDSGKPGADRIAFGFMANKGWAVPDLRPGTMPSVVVPSFKRLAHEYVAALPLMRRSYQLPDNKGVLWLGYDNDKDGVWFCMEEQAVPGGVTAASIMNEKITLKTAQELHTYKVEADDLLKAFGIRRGPHKDERRGREWRAAEYSYPDWAQ